jgi:hypothetical protein
MKRVSLVSRQRLAYSVVYSSVLVLLLVWAVKDPSTRPNTHRQSQNSALQSHFSSNDFDFMKGSGREENFRHGYTFTTETENILRRVAYDFYQCFLLTQQLAFYTHSPYLSSLSPLWNPSIPIAHRKLLI